METDDVVIFGSRGAPVAQATKMWLQRVIVPHTEITCVRCGYYILVALVMAKPHNRQSAEYNVRSTM